MPKDKDLRQVIYIWIAVIAMAITVYIYIDGAIASAATIPPCEPGGVHICQEQKPPSTPTGCVYGDSIPMDQCVDKSKNPPVIKPGPVVPMSKQIDINSPEFFQMVSRVEK